MAEYRPDHKRSKSALALSILHRDRLKTEDVDDDGPSGTGSDGGSDTGSPSATSHYHGLHRLRTSRHKHHGSVNTQNEPADIPNSNPGTTDSRRESFPDQRRHLTTEDFRKQNQVLAILNGGDEAALVKAVNDSSVEPLKGTTILHLAVQCPNDRLVEQILAIAKATDTFRLDFNARDWEGNTPLHLASRFGPAKTVRLLLNQPDINESITNYHGNAALDLAKNSEIHHQLKSARSKYINANIREVHSLVSSGEYEALEALLTDPRVENTLDVNRVELARETSIVRDGGTLLHEAAHKRDLRLIQLLLLHGADPFRRDRRGKLPQDVTKDERTRNILKKSPAAVAAQRGVQEKAVLGSATSPGAELTPGGKEGREMKGYLKKWTNYGSGWQLRWLVLEDGVLSYYEREDDAGAACRGAIHMNFAKLRMDPQDKTRFEIKGTKGKASIKYSLRANHEAEAKRWYWALNNAIQCAKDEAKEEARQKQDGIESPRQSKPPPGLALNPSQLSFQDHDTEPPSNDDGEHGTAYEPSLQPSDIAKITESKVTRIPGDADEEDADEFDDEVSSHKINPATQDAFDITAQSARLQLDLLSQMSAALLAENAIDATSSISDATISQTVSEYQSALENLQGLLDDLMRFARDREDYWQDRLAREANIRRMWEDSMARVVKEQEELEGRIGESEDKRKRTKRALRDALEGASVASTRPGSPQQVPETVSITEAVDKTQQVNERLPLPRRKSLGPSKRRPTITEITDLSDLDSEDDEEFFDAVDAGEVEVGEMPPAFPSGPVAAKSPDEKPPVDLRAIRQAEIRPSFKGYEGPVRTKLGLDKDNRPKISLWGILKSMIGKDMTKMTLPVSFNEPTSLLQRVCEDMEYTELLDTAADRTDSADRMLYVAAFAASEYASTIGRVAKPFNPLLGETYEYVRKDKDYRFFIEQVSHHPPIGAAWAESPRWDYYGESAVQSKFYGKSFDINPLGTWFLKLRPISGGEELYTWKKVTSSVIGIITGSPTVDNYGPMEIKNHNTGDTCFLDFKPRGWKASSAYQVSGKIVTADNNTRWSIFGRWNDKIYAHPGQKLATDQAYLIWEAHPRPDNIPFNLTPFVVTFQHLPDSLRPLIPPTDTRLRPDQRAMEDGKYELAAKEKERVEEKQRAKRRDREARGKEWEPRWFKRDRCPVTEEEYWVTTGEYWKNREKVSAGGTWKGVEDIF